MSIVPKSSLLGVMLVAAAAAGAQTTPTRPTHSGAATSTHADSAKMKKGARAGKRAARGNASGAHGGTRHDSTAAKPAGTPK